MDLFAPEKDVARCEAALAVALEHRLPLLVELAWAIRQRDPQRSQSLCQEAQVLLGEMPAAAGSDAAGLASLRARLDLMRAENSWLNMKPEMATQQADAVLQQFEQLGDLIGQADTHWVMAYVNAETGMIDLFDTHMQQCVTAALQAGDLVRAEMAQALRASWSVFRDLPSALAQWNKVFSPDVSDMPPGLASCISDFFFTAASLQGDFGSAIEYGMRTHTYSLQSGQMRTAIISATNTGDSFNSLNDHESALEWMQTALDLARKTGWPARIGGCLMQTAETLRKLGRLDAAEEMLTQALSILEALPGSRSYALALNYHGQLALDKKDYPAALGSFSQLQQRASALRQILVLWVLAEIYSRYALPAPANIDALSPALYYFLQALERADKIEGYTIAPELYEDLGHAYASLGQYQQAYEIGLQANLARQKTQSQYASKRALAIQIRQQTERARTESAHHRQLAEVEARRAEVLQKTNTTLANLGAIGQEITAQLAQAAVLEALNRHVHNLLDATCFTIYLMDADGKSMTSAIDIEAGQALPIDTLMLNDPLSNCVRCVHQRCEILLDVNPEEEQPGQVPGTLITLSALFAPLAIGERILGVMTIQTTQRYAYGERERMIFRSLCAYGAIALDNAHAYQQLADTLSTLRQTETKLLAQERQVRKHAEELAQANLALQENAEKLRLAKQKAEEATELKSEFLANMSHEIRTPMNAVIGMAHLALRTGLTLKQQDYLNKIHRAGLSLLGIINDILDFSKIEAGKLEVEQVVFSLDEVLANVASVSSQKAAEKRLEYLFDVAPDVPRHLLGDGLRLGQVLINLVNNAIKFTHEGEVSLSCRVVRQEPSGGGMHVQLQFIVRDTGIGMSQTQVESLFQPFSQADGSTTRKYGGTGLGLSISQHLVQLMGSKIVVQSSLGHGSMFAFTLDLALASSAPAQESLPPLLAQARVLVVDDNEAACEILCQSLRSLVARVDAASNAQQAQHAVWQAEQEGEPYLLVLTDLQLSGQDGLAMTRAIRQDARLQHKPEIILVTAFGKEEVQDQAEQAGVAGFVFKPINFSLLQQALASVFAPHQRMVVAGTLPLQQFVNCHVLLAEDNEINQQIAVELLEMVGMRVDVVGNGRAAFERLMAQAPDTYQLVLMDLEMPEMDGHEATLQLRREARFAQLPIVAMTAHALAEVRERCLNEGMQDYLSKPIHPELLYACLARWLPQYLRLPGNAVAPLIQARPPDAGLIPQTTAAPLGALQAGRQAHADTLQLPGIDSAQGLQTVAGNFPLYCRLLQRFAQSQRGSVEQVFHALDQGLLPDAMRLLHTLRGVAANIGACELAEAAGQLENMLQQGQLPDTTRLLALSSRMHLVLDGLRTQFGNQSLPFDEQAAMREALQAAQYLRHLLQEGNAEAIEYFEQCKNLLAAKLSRAHMLQLAAHLRHYQFDEAARLLEVA